ncbi:hypothetical protein K8R33_04830 [archaeon]|nr:hypothetical protein [archaeon]
MNILKFLGLGKSKEIISSKERISPKDLKDWINNKTIEVEKEEKNLLELIKEQIFKLIKELEEETEILENINVKNIKDSERIKSIAEGNLNKYILHLKKLVRELRKLELNQLPYLIERVDIITFEFQKNSRINYEKATILVGKEVINTKDSLKNFITYFKKTVERNKDLIEKVSIFSFVKKKVEEIEKIQELKSLNDDKKQEIEGKIKAFEDEKKFVKDNIEKIKNTKGYLDKKVEIENKKDYIAKEKDGLKNLFDLKSLAKKFHSDKKRREIIKEYRENFDYMLLKDKGEKIISLLDEVKSETISKRIKDIFERQREFDDLLIEKDEVEEYKLRIGNIDSQVKDLEFDVELLIKKQDKFDANLLRITNSVKEELIKIDVELDD